MGKVKKKKKNHLKKEDKVYFFFSKQVQSVKKKKWDMEQSNSSSSTFFFHSSPHPSTSQAIFIWKWGSKLYSCFLFISPPLCLSLSTPSPSVGSLIAGYYTCRGGFHRDLLLLVQQLLPMPLIFETFFLHFISKVYIAIIVRFLEGGGAFTHNTAPTIKVN